MARNYTNEKSALIVVSLLKRHNINQVIASPGTTNIAFVRSVQIDPFFTVYSAVDERSAAYMACGLAEESGRAVVLSCTGATASRNYAPGLTEAFYRKLPVLAITSTRDISKYGHHEDQVIDRTVLPKDVAKLSVHLQTIKDKNDVWDCRIKTNKAILELYRNGGGPVHINLTTTYDRGYTTELLPSIQPIHRFVRTSDFPKLPKGKIAIFIGSHKTFTEEENKTIDDFCEFANAVVFADHTSGYRGKYKIRYMLAMVQSQMVCADLMPDTLIHIGEISGFYHPFVSRPKEVWRVNLDGEIRDTFKRLKYVFQVSEFEFMEYYTAKGKCKLDYFNSWQNVIENLHNILPNLPFSNIWIAKKLSSQMPEGSNIHFGILNSLTSWNFFDVSPTINCNSNVGGYGIDGCVSSLIGASLANQDKLYFGIIGDLAFFYDLNAIGNRHVSSNLRILLVNNGKGMEFKINNNPAINFGDDADEYIAAAGHFGNKSTDLVKNYAVNLGFKYISASNKCEFDAVHEEFISTQAYDKPMIFEVFTDDQSESMALEAVKNTGKNFKGSAKKVVKDILGDRYVNKIKGFMK